MDTEKFDIQKGDVVRYSYLVYGTQCIGEGTVSKVNEDGSVVIDFGASEMIVGAKNIIERKPRADEGKKVVIPEDKTEEEKFNEMNTGVHIQKKENTEEEAKKEDKEAEKEESKTEFIIGNKKFKSFGK